MDHLVYELVSSNSVYSYVGHTTDVSNIDNQVVRPLYGFQGTDDECSRSVYEYIVCNQTYMSNENLLTIYQLSCLDPSVSETYIGKSVNGLDRVYGHIDSSCVEDSKVYAFIRSHGWWANWKITPMGRYWCGGKDDTGRLEWYWWKKTGALLNTQVPGISIIRRDCRKLKLSEVELFNLYEKFEERINRDYQGTELPPTFSNHVIAYIDCKAPPVYKYERYIRHPTMYVHQSSHHSLSYDEYVDDHIPIPTGCLFQMSNKSVPEIYIGFTLGVFTRMDALKCIKRFKSGRMAYLFMTMSGGGISNWKCELVTDKCSIRDYTWLSQYFALNNLSYDSLKCLFTDTNTNIDGEDCIRT
jgi:hypothetical protein